jgi:glycosyltransferase involved in cell wall biosynthesis
VFTVPNPFWKIADAPARPVFAGDAKIIVFVGWVIPDKGVRELVLACRDILDFELRLDLIGPVKEGFREELRALAFDRGNGQWMNMPGQVEGEEALARIANGFLVVLPSYTEGCPNVVLEAMMLGKPVVATPVGAIPEMLSFTGLEPCGICVPVRNVDALRTAIRSLLKQPDYALELGRRGRERVARDYSPEIVYARYKSIWEMASVR